MGAEIKTRVCDKESGGFRFCLRRAEVVGNDGRWRSENNAEFVSVSVMSSVTYEEARDRSLSFRSKREDGKRVTHTDYASQLGPPREIYGTKDEYLFPDGSKIFLERIRVDTLFRDPIAKERWNAEHAPKSGGHKTGSGCFGTILFLMSVFTCVAIAAFIAFRFAAK